jgi:hypothetical protein
MQEIALAIDSFRRDHNGMAPSRLSELVPKYLPASELLFNSKYSTSIVPANADGHPELVDIFSPYSFTILSDQRILVVENPSMWSDGLMSYFLFDSKGQPTNSSRVFQAFEKYHTTPEEFENRFSNGFH